MRILDQGSAGASREPDALQDEIAAYDERTRQARRIKRERL